ncbi:MAG: ABC transporter ATP-binding protein [Anaerolineaceae bacterium]|nr:ABC transporter ATP-binding protein [Anaerolineaceae bacterium]
MPLLKGISFSVGKDETMCVLGPSGGGKSTLLRIIAGLEKPDEGQVVWNEKDITAVPPHLRKFGLMFQDYALFPHLNVFENIAFGLRMQHIVQSEINKRVDEALEMVSLRQIAYRSVTDLSGGEKQRIAFARALAPKPNLLMLDEPMGSLDRALRDQLIKELHMLISKMDIPVIYVTHDQEEAFSIADRILILNKGRIAQSGSPQYIYTHPESFWVASFFGLKNRFEGKICSLDPIISDTLIGKISFSCRKEKFEIGETIDLVVLPTAIGLKEKNDGLNYFEGRIIDNIFKGNRYTTRIKIRDKVEFSFQTTAPFSKGEKIGFTIDPDSILCFRRKK